MCGQALRTSSDSQRGHSKVLGLRRRWGRLGAAGGCALAGDETGCVALWVLLGGGSGTLCRGG
ncbi:hypothetical protein Q9233_002444 [Columba guinea]|nr:hypothetical protein Q9233_002444 [Columba guinea]